MFTAVVSATDRIAVGLKDFRGIVARFERQVDPVLGIGWMLGVDGGNPVAMDPANRGPAAFIVTFELGDVVNELHSRRNRVRTGQADLDWKPVDF